MIVQSQSTFTLRRLRLSFITPQISSSISLVAGLWRCHRTITMNDCAPGPLGQVNLCSPLTTEKLPNVNIHFLFISQYA